MKDDYYFDRGVAERYDAEVGEDFLGDQAFYLRLAREAAAGGHKVLELAVGTGRVAIAVAKAGVQVVGLDQSPAMLEVAHGKAGDLANLRLVQGDMVDFDLGETFGLVYIPARSFLLLATVAQQKSCLARVHKHLAPGGKLALNFFNPDIPLMAAWMGSSRKGLQPGRESPLPGGGKAIEWDTRRYLTVLPADRRDAH